MSEKLPHLPYRGMELDLHSPSGSMSRLTLSDNSSLPVGPIARLEPKPWQIDLLQNVPEIKWAMIDAKLASQFTNRGFTANSIPQRVAITSTFSDAELEYWFNERYVETAKTLDADCIVPCDCPVYEQDPESFRRETVDAYTDNLEETYDQFVELGTEVVPLVKGESEFERGICFDTFDDLGIRNVSFYAGQYFSYGYRFDKLRSRLQQIDYEFSPENLMVIGLQSERLLPELPPCVTSAAGLRWLREIEFGDIPLALATDYLGDWAESMNEALGKGQTTLYSFEEVGGFAYG